MDKISKLHEYKSEIAWQVNKNERAKELSAAPSVMQKLFVRIEHSGSR